MRKLATIQKIEEILPIEGADLIEKVRIKGWHCVALKGEFKPGDLCCYFEIDSLVPNIPAFSFLSKGLTLKKVLIDNGKEVEGYRIKTKKLLGQISQGLAMPLSTFPQVTSTEIGTDVSELLDVYKFERPIPFELAGEMKGEFPGFIPKTDEERVQNCLDLLEKHKGQRFFLTEKIDGTSSTYFKRDNEFGVCGHGLEFKENEKTIFWRLANKYSLRDRLTDGFAVQAETAGEGIQSNRLKIKGVDLFVFYVINIDTWEYLKPEDMKLFVKDLGLKTVPIIDENFILNHSCDEIIKLADGPSVMTPSLPKEGIVFRLYDSKEKITFKVLSNEYLLKYGL